MKQKIGFRDSLFTVHCSLFTVHRSLSTVHRSLFTLLTLSLLAAFAPQAEAVQATGGNIAQYITNGTNYIVHTFTTGGTFNVTSAGNVELLVVAGGGGGGSAHGGGGGAGGVIQTNASVQAGSNYTVVVGGGGAGGATNGYNKGATGSDSSFGTNSTLGTLLVAKGGGGGGAYVVGSAVKDGLPGGSGGGGGGSPTAGTGGVSNASGQGNAGGNGDQTGGAGGGGGGGGYSTAGTNAVGVSGGQGGSALSSSISGTLANYAGGGGGGGWVGNGGTSGAGGGGGAGKGGQLSNTKGDDALVNTGSGGGGGSDFTPGGGDGGSGIVIVRCANPITPSQMKIAFAGYTNRSEVLTNFPVLVVFSNNVNNSGFHYGYFATTNGYDLRFGTDARPPTNSLNYEIESWNPNGASYIWVQVPTIPTNGSGAIWANWGNTSASNQLPCTTNGATWDSRYAGVMHLNEAGHPYSDSTTNRNGSSSTSDTSSTPGMMGNALSCPGSTDAMTLQRNVISNAPSFTVEHWIKLAANQTQTTIFSDYNRWVTGISDSSQNVVKFYFGEGGGGTAYSGSALPINVWQHVAVTYGSGVGTIYVNGLLAGSLTASIAGIPQATSKVGYIQAGGQRFNGAIDELRISSVCGSSNYIWACYQTMASNTLFSNYGKMEKQPSPQGTLIMMR